MRWRWWRKPSNAACLSSRSSMVTGAIIQPGPATVLDGSGGMCAKGRQL
jgi:hypothetical protein